MKTGLLLGTAIWLVLLSVCADARAQELRFLLVTDEPFVVCPRGLESPACPTEIHIPLDVQPMDPARILPPVATVTAKSVNGAYGVGVDHCRMDTDGYTIPTNPAFQVPGSPEVKSPAVGLSVIPASNGKQTRYALRVASQPCMRSAWEIEQVVVFEVMP